MLHHGLSSSQTRSMRWWNTHMLTGWSERRPFHLITEDHRLRANGAREQERHQYQEPESGSSCIGAFLVRVWAAMRPTMSMPPDGNATHSKMHFSVPLCLCVENQHQHTLPNANPRARRAGIN